MSKVAVRWQLNGGYSRLLDRTRLEVTLEKGPVGPELKLSPFGLFEKPIELILRVDRGFRAAGPGNIRWGLNPGGRIRAVVLQPGNAYLGNYRVPGGHFAVQWDVEAKVASNLTRLSSGLLISAEAGSTLMHSWVKEFASGVSLGSAIDQSWQAYVDPFEPKEVLQMSERQVVRWRWSGLLSTAMSVEWGLAKGWQVGASKSVLGLQAVLRAGAGLRAGLKVIRRGSFVLRLTKRRGQVQVSITEDRELSRSGTLSVRASLRDTVKLKSKPKLLEPLLKPLNERLAKALARRAEIEFVLESRKWRRRHTLLKASWKRPIDLSFIEDYQKLLSGELPGSRSGFELSGQIESVQGKRLSIDLNILSWIKLGRSSERRKFYRVELGPGGEVTIEEGEVVEKTRYRWDELQLISLLYGQRVVSGGNEEKYLWSFRQRKRFQQLELVRMLKKALRLRSIASFDLPSVERFPLQLELYWSSEFSPVGIEAVRMSPREQKWNALVAALQIAEPDRYRKGNFWMDWIVSSSVRDTIDSNPVQSHLESLYPISGRSSFQRKQVVVAYLRVKKFLQLIELWEKGNRGQVMKSLSLGWELPIFFWFHLLCPPDQRRSAVLLTGDMERIWGDTSVIGNRANFDR